MSTRTSNSLVRALKQSIADALLADPYFATIPVYVLIPKDIFSQIEQGLLPVEGGVAVFIEAFHAGKTDANNPGPYYGESSTTVTVVESPPLNESNPDCDEISEKAQSILQTFGPLGGPDTCWMSNPSEVENKTLSIRRFYVNMPIGFQPATRPALPAIVATPAPGPGLEYPLTIQLALASYVPGAAIYYTLDGSYPSPRNPSALNYFYPPPGVVLNENFQEGAAILNEDSTISIEPLVINAAGARLLARAYLEGYASGQPAQFLFQ